MPSAVWYAKRLAAMSPQEILFRVRRIAKIQLERLPGLTRSAPVPDLQALRRATSDLPYAPDGPYRGKAATLLQGRMDVFACRNWSLGEPPDWNRDPKTGRTAPLSFGKVIDYRDERLVGNIKYLWEPSRHLKLPVLTQAYRVTGDRKYLDCLVHLLDSWIRQCPYPTGIHWCSALEAGIRLINWSLAWRFVGGIQAWRQQAGGAFVERWLESIWHHMQFIDGYYSGFSSANNHLIGEAAGVYVAANTWPAWSDSGKLRKRARAILLAEIENQTYVDGVNKEQAIAYQQFVLDFFLLAGLSAADAGEAFPDGWWKRLESMMQFVSSIMDSGGNVPMIGDADDGFVTDLGVEPDFCNYRSLLATGAILFDRPDFAVKVRGLDSKTRWLLGNADERYRQVRSRPERAATVKREFPQAGYYVLGGNLDCPGEVRIVFDAGPLGLGSLAAHGHADALSFTLSASGIPVIVDPGTYAYHTDELWRDYFRGTSAHNTVRIDGADQSEIGGNFMWKRHAQAKVLQSELGHDRQFVDASHDGYTRLPDPVVHRRKLLYDRNSTTLHIEDRLECRGEHLVEMYFHFPEYAALTVEGDRVTITARGQTATIESRHGLIPDVHHADDRLPLGWISYNFDQKLPAYTLRYSGKIRGNTSMMTWITVT